MTHAHADHYPPNLYEVHATPATLKIAEARWKGAAGKMQASHPFHKPFIIGDAEITLLPSGHMPGAAQIWISAFGRTALFSGDLLPGIHSTSEALAYPTERPDLLVMESTFGEKEEHPAEKDELIKHLGNLSRSAIVGVYPVGKAQRMNALMSEMLPEVEVYVHHEIHRYHRIYENLGFAPGRFQPYRRGDAQRAEKPWVMLVPPRVLAEYATDERYLRFFASGWKQSEKLYWLHGDLEISDHASQSQLLEYIRRVNPREVIFWHGYPHTLMASCMAAGIPATSVK